MKLKSDILKLVKSYTIEYEKDIIKSNMTIAEFIINSNIKNSIKNNQNKIKYTDFLTPEEKIIHINKYGLDPYINKRPVARDSITLHLIKHYNFKLNIIGKIKLYLKK